MIVINGQVYVDPIFCEGCQEQMDGFSQVLGYTVCMPCVKARHRAVVNRKCTCGRKRRIITHDFGHRKVEKCLRCLGHVRQLS